MENKKAAPDTKSDSIREEAGGSRPSAVASLPPWRSVQMAPVNESLTRSIPQSLGAAPVEVIDKASFFAKATKSAEKAEQATSNWIPTKLRPVPAFYPLENSSRFVDDDLNAVAGRLSECLRVLSVHAVYNNDTATASLTTSENVEMHLSLWKTNGGKYPEGIVVELQRRKGDSIAFHRYSRYILDAAIGDFDAQEHTSKYGADFELVYSKKVQRMLQMESGKATEEENAVIAIEIAHGLLMKDRMDARQLGLESLCLLTDPKKTGLKTALIASQVVLLGSARGATGTHDNLIFDEAPFQEIRETILSLVQLRRIGDEEDFEDTAADGDCDLEDDMGERSAEVGDHITVLHNLALAVLANALNVVENSDGYDEDPEDTDKKPAAFESETTESIMAKFMEDSKEFSKREILSTLIHELGKAERKPHNACLSAKCLGALCRASEEAKRRAKELGAKTVVATALDVGERTHLKLETECKTLSKVLNQVADDEN